MIYTAEEKRKIDAILVAFGDYIKGSDFFDVLYSDKVGYIMMTIAEEADTDTARVGSVKKLLFLLFNEITNDVLLGFAKDFGGDLILTEEKKKEVVRRITVFLEKVTEDREGCFRYLEEFFAAYPDVWDEWD